MTPDWKAQLSAMSGVGYLPKNDYNASGAAKTSDVLMRNSSTGLWELHEMSAYQSVATTSIALPSSSDYTYVATLNTGATGGYDVLVITRRTSDGGWHASRVAGKVVASEADLSGINTSAAWQFAVAGDFNGDGQDDLLLRNSSTGQYWVYLMNNGVVGSSNAYNAFLSLDYVPQVAADFDADGDDDLLERQTSNGLWGVFVSQNGQVVNALPLGSIWANAGYTFQFASDLNNDGFDDIVLRNTGAGGANAGYWYRFMLGTSGSPPSVQRFVVTGWDFLNFFYDLTAIQLAAVGDYNGDGSADGLLHDVVNNRYYVSRVSPSTGQVVAPTYWPYATDGTTAWQDPNWVVQQARGK
jgi:hypothetical protein